jgi:hypothetical protein
MSNNALKQHINNYLSSTNIYFEVGSLNCVEESRESGNKVSH